MIQFATDWMSQLTHSLHWTMGWGRNDKYVILVLFVLIRTANRTDRVISYSRRNYPRQTRAKCNDCSDKNKKHVRNIRNTKRIQNPQLLTTHLTVLLLLEHRKENKKKRRQCTRINRAFFTVNNISLSFFLDVQQEGKGGLREI